ncbi:bacterio-opsin activator domain-containing protein [Halalkalicoccus jeotgali]|uniref:PAS/PAC sensor protein n=1 Tax=Halalkalicoccus jeotgali (strain DSM 18796 / CECT 7217 / JCM 14584 / KCTC 4019 / B3) TaxID=795797 RepID=D8J8V7_HALJB|nr:bacterio-opsin activator domain-containing protein [Halalkalicoccus jeotgali]ADJ14292.1 putative PAS/PAC sensor protein [Halalkalicoccus jeotgali B3]ELY40554.1 putative PAS/PAC sensor protein [Halalkalicoccus jeotgali B3]
MAEILLLIDRDENRRLLAEWLSNRHEVVGSLDEGNPKRSPDLCILDRASLERHASRLAKRKRAAEPVFLPYLLVVSQQHLTEISSEIWSQIDAVVQEGVDELITAPVKKTELHGRIENLLRTRELSVDLRDRNDELRTLNHINAVIRTVNGALVTAVTREEIEREVCEQLADAPPYRFAWIGEPAVTGRTVEPRTAAGVEEGYLDAKIPVEANGEPTGEALSMGEARFVRSDEHDREWTKRALEREYPSIAAVPLVYGETVYGVLGVYSDRSEAFGGDERAVLEELGRTIGHAINAAESKKALFADTVTELRLIFEDTPAPLVALSRSGYEVSLEGAVSDDDGNLLEFYAIDGPSPSEALEELTESPAITSARLITEHDGEALFELRFGESLLEAFADQGATVESLTGADGRCSVVATLPQSVAVKAVVEGILSRYPDGELRAQRQTERSTTDRGAFRAALEADLTERQREVLQAAYLSGFFGWPRESTGEEIAQSLGITPSTLHQHLRVGERKLLDAFFERDGRSDT